MKKNISQTLIRSILRIFTFFSLISNTNGQTFQNQEYIYNNNNIRVEIKTKKIVFNHNDTLSLKIKVINISKEDVYIFQKPFSNIYSIKDILCQKIYINYVFKYMSGSEMLQELLILPSGEEKSLTIKIAVDSLQNMGFKENVRIILGLGYIDSFTKIEKFKHMTDMNISIKNSKIKLSSNIIDAALRREIVETFSIVLKK